MGSTPTRLIEIWRKEGLSRAEQRRRHHTDAVFPPIRLDTGGHDEGVEQIPSHLPLEPEQMLDIVVLDGTTQLDFDGDDPAVGTLHDQVDLMPTATGPEMSQTRFGCLCVDANGLRHEGFEEVSEKRPVPRDVWNGLSTLQERPGIDAEEPRRESWIGEVMLGLLCELR